VDAAAGVMTEVVEPRLGVRFVAPPGWSWGVNDSADGDQPVITAEGETGAIAILKEPNPTWLSLGEWFDTRRQDYHPTLMNVLADVRIGTTEMLVTGQPESCVTTAMLVAIVADGGNVYTLQYVEKAGRPSAPEFAAILDSLTVGSTAVGDLLAGVDVAQIPTLAENTSCESLQATVSPAGTEALVENEPLRCAGSDMFVPSPGPNIQPWGCFSYDPICGPYNPTSKWGSYFKLPHRGTDLYGEIGVTPVYATWSGTAYKYYASNIRIAFDAPYVGRSVWMAHMASQDGKTDFRRVVNGQKVSAGQFIGYTGYYNTSGDPPHLHISYVNNAYGGESWPSIDPTKFLGTRNMVWYEGWNFQQPLECASPKADEFEPDNFSNMAEVGTTDGAETTHDFHAPGDEDWVKFPATIGSTYLFETDRLEPRSDTQLAVVSYDGRTVLAENDDAGPGELRSALLWKAPSTRTYFVRVRHFSFRGYEPFTPAPAYSFPVYGPNTAYTLRIKAVLPNLAAGRPALATTYDAENAWKPNLAVDGDVTTAWGSHPGAPSPQWWWVDTGLLSFNRVHIRWGESHAARYFVGWSNDGRTFTGYTFEVPGPGEYAHALMALRTYRYVGIRMEIPAAGKDHYNIEEVGVYRWPTVTGLEVAVADGEGPPLLEPSGEPITWLRGEETTNVYLPGVVGGR
jgi:murein DD-endopeptidase MepM/ murein hydrolase activator NlpD